MTKGPAAKFGTIALTMTALAFFSAPAKALTAQECSAKYNAAKSAGTLGEMKWNDFRKAHCGSETETAAKSNASGAVFPKGIDPKYAKESPGRARMHTCRDQYQANKAKNGNGGMKWIMKGGGYYSLCNKALKG